ncbi:hypothetical protein [Streptomyces sp. NPDC001250]|uniref:hypothetical protein n=1 Tax=Streptomyces sp. NPDC001250 TaxID=3154382 RepID=UPI00332FEDB7
MSAQLAFGLEAERSGRKATVTLMFRTPPSSLPTADVHLVVQSVVLRNPALSYRIQFSRGAAYQEWCPTECDFAELQVASEDAVSGCVMEVIEKFEISLNSAPMAARLIRSPESDNLLLVFDHALVDEQSILLIKRQLEGPSTPDDRQMERYRAAIIDRKSSEEAAAAGPGVKFWEDRLEAAGEFPRRKAKTPRIVPLDTLPSVVIPRSFRGSLFPYVLFAIHRALRDVSEPGPTVIGYPWGGRNSAYSDVVGCFMNTLISLDTTGPEQSPAAAADFLRRWYAELDHADVPFTTVVSLGSKFSGSVTTQLSYRHAGERTVKVAGVPAVEFTPSQGRGPLGPAFLTGVTVHDNELQLRLLLDEEITGYGSHEFGTRWRHWLKTTISGFPERRS